MNLSLLLAALVALPVLGAAQNTELNRDKAGNLNSGYALVAPDANVVRGTPFVVASWLAASLQLAASSSPLTAPLKYDAYRQELRVQRPQGDSVVVPLRQVREFTLTGPGRRFVCYPAASLPADVNGACAEVLADGPQVQLLKFWRKDLVKRPAENTTYGSNATMNVLEDNVHYYLRWPADGHLTALRLKRASLEQALASQPAALAALKARKGSLSTEAEVAAAIAALNPLLVAPAR